MSNRVREKFKTRTQRDDKVRSIAIDIQKSFSELTGHGLFAEHGHVTVPSNGRSGVYVVFNQASMGDEKHLDDVMSTMAQKYHGRYAVTRDDENTVSVDFMFDRRP